MIPTCAGITASALSKSIGSRQLWQRLSFEVTPRSTLAVMGPSGSGKSTLLHCLGALDDVDSGRIQIDGHNLATSSPRIRRRLLQHRIGLLFQDHGLVPEWSVRQNVNLGLSGRRGSVLEALSIDDALDAVGLSGHGSRKAYSLSGGEQQRVALARLLAKGPTVVLADEPTASLDAGASRLVLQILGQMRDRGAAIVIATHDDDAAAWCDGRLALRGTPAVDSHEP